jgi:hypothetical protein
MQRGRSPVSLSDLLKAGVLEPEQPSRFRGRADMTATITIRGTLVFRAIEYKSLSSAAKAAANGHSTNGWISWLVEDESRWISLATIRDRFLSKSIDTT